MSRELMIRLADVWASLATRPFICTQAADESRAIVGGIIYGYYAEDNPTAFLGHDEGGHDFLVVDDRWILDFWAAAYYGEMPVWDLHEPSDAADIARLYGPRDKWTNIDTRPKEPRFLEDN
jgi:hypothetical protein